MKFPEADIPYRSLLESITDAVIATDREGRITYVNPAAVSITGLLPDDMLGHTIPDALPFHNEKERFSIRADLEAILSSRRNHREGTASLRTGPDRLLPVDWWLTHLSPSGEERSGLLMQLHNATKDREAEEQLRLASRVFDNTHEGVMITDRENRILTVNPSFTRVTGYTSGEVIGENPRFLKSDRHPAGFYENMWRQITEHGTWKGEIWNRKKNGEIYLEWLHINVIRDEEGEILNHIGIFSDITRRRETEKRLKYLASHDTLTDIPNRALFYDRLEHAIARSHRNEEHLSLLFLDLDHFKTINDTLGHHTGDLLLRSVAERIRGCLRESDTLARFGGDEFTIIIENITGRDDAIQVADRILAIFKSPFELEDHSIFTSTSIGISFYPDHGRTGESLIKKADDAMYRAKEEGKNRAKVYQENGAPA